MSFACIDFPTSHPTSTPMTRDTTGTQGRAIVAARADEAPVDTDEIAALAEAAGYDVIDRFSQTRPTDPGTELGAGKLDELAQHTEATAVDLVAIDADLTPGQHRSIAERLPEEVRLFDRHRLVLDIFARQAGNRRATLQVELATLEYDLARYEAEADENRLTRMTEKGSPRYDMRDRIDRLKRELDDLPEPGAHLRARQREDGFDLLTLAGYTNAGKSTLLHRLADDLADPSDIEYHPDTDPVAAIEDRLFKTLETTTRRATIDGRPVLCTDTVGYVQELPHNLVASFSETLSAAAASDVVILVTDATDSSATYETKLETSLDVLKRQGVEREAILVALNKIDAVGQSTVTDRLEHTRALDLETVPISARQGRGIEALQHALLDRLPTDRRTIRFPQSSEAMSVVAEAHERAIVEDTTYGPETIELTVSGRPSILERLDAKTSSHEV